MWECASVIVKDIISEVNLKADTCESCEVAELFSLKLISISTDTESELASYSSAVSLLKMSMHDEQTIKAYYIPSHLIITDHQSTEKC